MHVQIVAEVTIIDDGRIKLLCVRHDDLIDVLCYHARRLAVLRVDCEKMYVNIYASV